MAPQRRVKGDRSFRKLLRQMPDVIKEQMATELDEAGDALLIAMRAEVPSKTGALRLGLSKKLLRGALKLKVGLIGKGVNRRLFYGRVVEFGRKAQTVTVRRFKRGGRKEWMRRAGVSTRTKPNDLVSTYQLRVRPMRARPFVYSRRTALREVINKRLARFWEKVLAKTAAGVTDD